MSDQQLTPTGEHAMTPRETVIEKIAFAIAMANGSTKELNIEIWKQSIRVSAIAALDGLLAALPGLGIKLVPLVATEDQVEAGWIDKEDVNPDDIYIKMLAASTNPLEKPE